MTSLIEQVIAELARFVIAVISKFGYMGIVATMAIESRAAPRNQ